MVLHRLIYTGLFVYAIFSLNPVRADENIKAKAAPKRASIDMGRVMHITYGSKSWNLDSAKVDTAMIILREKNSGKIVQIQLEETEPDSSQFDGHFSVNLGDQDKISPEIYVPPPEFRGGDKDGKKLYEMIRSGKLPRKPLIWKKNDKGQSVLDVYDTREQAEAALAAYQEEQRLAQEIRRKKPLKPMSNATAMGAAAAAEHKAQLDKLAAEAAHHAIDRVRMEQIEKQKSEERERQAQQLSEQEKEARRQQGALVGAEGLALYGKGEYPEAESKFKQAIELDPSNQDFLYKYGITLYRNQKYNEALVALKAAKVEPNLDLERKYYMGLVYYRLSELDNALGMFNEVGRSNDATMGPSALFYEGVIEFAQEKYDACKKAFEKVIDTSSDPRIDAQAEEYLDRIAGAMAYQKMRENKWTLSAVVGLMYDSNVLLSPDNTSSSSSPTNTSDERLLTLADLQFRPIFDEKHEFAPHATINLTNSAKAASAVADPFLYTLAAPYSWKGAFASKKSYKFTATPGYELLYLDPSGTGTKSLELSAYYLTLDETLVMNKDWVSSYTFEYRNEKSSDPSSIGPADLSGNKYTLRTVQTFFLDKARKKALLPSLGYIREAAVGSQKSFNRYDLGATYIQPIAWNLGWNAGLSYYQLNYPGTSDPNRTDKDLTLTTGISKPIRDWVTWGLTGSYTKNSSTDANFQYTKYLILTTATFVTNF